MSVELTTSEAAIRAEIAEHLKRVERVIERRLAYLGEECVNVARKKTYGGKDYKDRTGNLRSSTGYILVKNGRIIRRSKFSAVKKGAEGADAGLAYAESLAGNYPEGYALIVVAGMSYAVFVKHKGYDVIDSARLFASKKVRTLAEELKKEVEFNS